MKGAYNPRLLATVCVTLAILLLIAAVVISSRTKPVAGTTAAAPVTAPQPTVTYTSYTPVAWQECLDAMDAADNAITEADKRYDATIKAAAQPNTLTGLREKERLIEQAKKAHKDWTNTVLKEYAKLSKECREK